MAASREHRQQLYQQMVGRTIAGRFKITRLLGFGGMGAVYEATQRNMQRSVALKVIPAHDPTTTARFQREAMTISRLHHPNTVTVFDYGQSDNGVLFLAMEMLSGQNLGDLIKARGCLTPNEAVHIATQVCRSLSEAHRAKIVHRDIKPDNIFLIRVDDDPNFVKVLDFGIAKILKGEDNVELTGANRIIGTPKYMSPEQILGDAVDHRSDIYSLGCIVFEMICGTPPFQDSNTTKLMIAHAQQAPPTFSERLPNDALARIPGPLEQVVRRALAKSPDERYRDTDEFRDALETALDATNSSIRISELASRSTQINPALPANLHPNAPASQNVTDSSDMLAQHSSQTLNRLRPPPYLNTANIAGHNPTGSQQAGFNPSGVNRTGQHPDGSGSESGARPLPNISQVTTPPPATKSNRGPLIAILIALLLIGAVGVFLVLQPGEPPVGAPPTNPVDNAQANLAALPQQPAIATPGAGSGDPEPDPAAPVKLSVQVLSTPSGARVYQEGRVVGRTPMTIHGKDGDTLDYSFELAGYKELSATYELSEGDAEATFAVRLEPKPSAKSTRPPRKRPTPKPKPDKSSKDTPAEVETPPANTKPVVPNVEKLDDSGGTTIELLN